MWQSVTHFKFAMHSGAYNTMPMWPSFSTWRTKEFCRDFSLFLRQFGNTYGVLAMDMEKSMPPMKRTVVVLDHSSKFLALSKQHIDFDGGGKKSKGKSSASSNSSPVFKSSWTCSIEAAVEYCRIVYDIFPNLYLVSKMAISVGGVNLLLLNSLQKISQFPDQF